MGQSMYYWVHLYWKRQTYHKADTDIVIFLFQISKFQKILQSPDHLAPRVVSEEFEQIRARP
jgi:hypothetical protein